MEKERMEIKTGVTPKSLVIGIVLTLFAVFYFGTWGPFMALVTWHPVRGLLIKDLWPISIVTDFGSGVPGPHTRLDAAYGVVLFMGFLPVLISALLPARYRLSINELAFIYSMTTPATMIPNIYTGAGFSILAIPTVYKHAIYGPIVQQYISPLFGPKDAKIIAPMETGRAAVPWIEWTAPIAFWITFCLSLYFFTLFIAAIFRKMYINVEALPFPLARVTHETLSLATSKDAERKPRLFRAKWLWLGTTVSALVMLSATMPNWYFPIKPIPLSYDLTPTGITLSQLAFFYWPPIFGIGLILPMDVTLTQALTYIITMLILTPTFVTIGQLGSPPLGQMAHVLRRDWMNPDFAHLIWDALGLGVMLGIGIWPIIVHRAEVIESIKSIRSGESILDRIQWIGLIVSGAVLLGLFAAVGSPVQYAIPIIVYAGVAWMCIGRIQAEGGGPLGGTAMQDVTIMTGNRFPQMIAMNMGLIGPTSAPITYPTMCLETFLLGHGASYPYILNNSQVGWSLDSYQIGNLTKTKDTDLFISQSIGVMLSVLITLPVSLWLLYTYGWVGRAASGGEAAKGAWVGQTYDLVALSKISGTAVQQPNSGTYAMILIGFMLVVVISILRARFAGVFNLISPAGIWLGLQWGAYWWFAFLITTIINATVRKVGGIKLYNVTIIPLAVGLILGWALIYPFAALSQILIGLGYRWW